MNLTKGLLSLIIACSLTACNEGSDVNRDQDGDGFPDLVDVFPADSSEWVDYDEDGIGDNADTDDDNDGVDDAIDVFPNNPNESFDFDQDGIGDNADFDDDNDDVPDTADRFPFDASEFQDFDNDSIGDNADNDDDNDGIQDENDNIDVIGYKAEYLQSEAISIVVRGFNEDGDRLLAENGWHMQYYVYDQDSNQLITSLTSEGFYNGAYDTDSQQWSAQFPAPPYLISYRVEVSIYCSLGTEDCEGASTNDYTANQTFEFSLVCHEQADCIFTPPSHKATQLTNKQSTQDLPRIVIKDNGDLVVGYRDFDDVLNTSVITSGDSGTNWQQTARIQIFQESLASTLLDEVVGLYHRDFSICLIAQREDENPIVQSLAPLLTSLGISPEGAQYPFSNFALKQTNDGGFLIGFSLRRGSEKFNGDLYLIKTFNFAEVHSYSRLSDDSTNYGYGSLSVAENADASLTVMYFKHHVENHSVTWIVENGMTLDSLGEIGSTEERFQDMQVVEIGGASILLGNQAESIFQLQIENANIQTNGLVYSGGVQLGFSAVALSDSEIAIVYEADWNEQRDIFFDKITLPNDD